MLIARFICAFLLHINLEPEVRQSINMIKYSNNHSSEFKRKTAPLMISILQYTSAMFTEGINICLICGSSTVLDVVLNFVALCCIADIDD